MDCAWWNWDGSTQPWWPRSPVNLKPLLHHDSRERQRNVGTRIYLCSKITSILGSLAAVILATDFPYSILTDPALQKIGNGSGMRANFLARPSAWDPLRGGSSSGIFSSSAQSEVWEIDDETARIVRLLYSRVEHIGTLRVLECVLSSIDGLNQKEGKIE